MVNHKHYWQIGLLAGVGVALALTVICFFILKNQLSGPREAPEAENVLIAQTGVPFQVLIPAYLPAGFNRSQVEIRTDQTGPLGEAMVSLIYTTRAGMKLTLNEWIPLYPESTGVSSNVFGNQGRGVKPCNCKCTDKNLCSIARLMVDIGNLHIMGETSNPDILSRSLLQTILGTLGPASGMLVYSSIEDVPLISDLPPAVEVPVDSSGIQEVVLVVSQEGYTPVHFSVKKDIPVRLTFKQLGDVGCGNELYIEWGAQMPGHLLLATSSDRQILDFTPRQAGDFLFHCPHYIYQGVMTVID